MYIICGIFVARVFLDNRMPWYDFLWSYEPEGNFEHIAEHGICPDEVEWVVQNPLAVGC